MLISSASALRDFIEKESAGGIVLIGAAILALIAANSPAAHVYSWLMNLPVSVTLGSVGIAKPLLLWINDGLMAVFFFLVGLEVKREIVSGELSSWEKASLPLISAIGGMAMPALVFLSLNLAARENIAGWAIPAATDIAFALGILSLLGPGVPAALKTLLLAIAVIDDIGAIAIIALFYTGALDAVMLAGAGVALAGLMIANRMRVGSSAPYVLLALVMWVFVLKSGVHATLAGVAAAMTVPLSARGDTQPLHRMESALHPWVAFLVLPLFGFANAGVSLAGLTPADLLKPLPLGIALGLLVGKQLGVFGFAFAAAKMGITSLPRGVTMRQLHGLSLLAAIGFTMSLFIGNLAFTEDSQLRAVKVGVLAGSLVAATAGFVLLRVTVRPIARG